MKQKKEEVAGIGVPTGVYCNKFEFRNLLEIIKEVNNSSLIQVSGNVGVGTVKTKLIKTQADVFIYVSKLAEKYKLPYAFYGINIDRQFIKVREGREDDFHNIYSYK